VKNARDESNVGCFIEEIMLFHESVQKENDRQLQDEGAELRIIHFLGKRKPRLRTLTKFGWDTYHSLTSFHFNTPAFSSATSASSTNTTKPSNQINAGCSTKDGETQRLFVIFSEEWREERSWLCVSLRSGRGTISSSNPRTGNPKILSLSTLARTMEFRS
jgi:hypothetical protein